MPKYIVSSKTVYKGMLLYFHLVSFHSFYLWGALNPKRVVTTSPVLFPLYHAVLKSFWTYNSIKIYHFPAHVRGPKCYYTEVLIWPSKSDLGMFDYSKWVNLVLNTISFIVTTINMHKIYFLNTANMSQT